MLQYILHNTSTSNNIFLGAGLLYKLQSVTHSLTSVIVYIWSKTN